MTCNEPIARKLIFINVTTPRSYPNATKRPLVYNPIIGWNIGGALSALLIMFLVYFGMERMKIWCLTMYKYRQVRKELKLIRASQVKHEDQRDYIRLEDGHRSVTIDGMELNTEHPVTLRINRESIATCPDDNAQYEDHNVLDNTQYKIIGRINDSFNSEALSSNTLHRNLNAKTALQCDKVRQKASLRPRAVSHVRCQMSAFGLCVLEIHPD